MTKTRILTVCLGNICRSPLAKGILDSLVDPKEVVVDSAGTGDYHIGDPPDERSVEVAKKNGLDITDQRGRQFKADDLVRYDFILAMDNYNYEDIVSLASNEQHKDKVKLILNYAIPGENLDLPDPYFGGISGFDDVYAMLTKACRNFVDKELKMDKSDRTGKLFIIPSRLGEQPPLEVLPLSIRKKINDIDHFIVENEKVTRRFIKKIVPGKSQNKIKFFNLNKYTQDTEIPEFLEPCIAGHDTGLLSDAGCPGIADPGSELVRLAHDKNIQVVPLVGPSSVFLGLMASGLNGQSFAFHGYLPIDKKECRTRIKHFEKLSEREAQTQIFIETPYRNQQLFDLLLRTLSPGTLLTVACDLSLSDETIHTRPVSEWEKEESIDIHKRQCIFLFRKVR